MNPLKPNRPVTAYQSRLDALLDEALAESFPASDPIAISFESPERAVRSPKLDGE